MNEAMRGHRAGADEAARRFVRVDSGGEPDADAALADWLAERQATSARWSASSSPSSSADGSPPIRAARCTPRPREPRARSAPIAARALARMGRCVGGGVARRGFVVRDPRRRRDARAARGAAQLVAFDAPNNPVVVLPSGVVVDASAVAVLPFVAAGDATLAAGPRARRRRGAAHGARPLRIADNAVQPYAGTSSTRGNRWAARRARPRRRRRRARRRPRPRQRATARSRDRSDVMAGGSRSTRRRAARGSQRDRRERRCDDVDSSLRERCAWDASAPFAAKPFQQ